VTKGKSRWALGIKDKVRGSPKPFRTGLGGKDREGTEDGQDHSKKAPNRSSIQIESESLMEVTTPNEGTRDCSRRRF